MGNTMIQDSTTGNIMGLRDGFVPIGMKEYGGILYIASYNQKTNQGELGTIPSPLFNYIYDSASYPQNIKIADINQSSQSMIDDYLPKYLQQPFKVSDTRFQVGDQFIINLSFSTNTKTVRGQTSDQTNWKDCYYNLITGFNKENDLVNYGWFNFSLLAKVEKSGDTVVLSNISNVRQKYYTEDDLQLQLSQYWFLPNVLNLDNDRCQAEKLYRTYPNILPGYLYVQVKAELPEQFEFFTNGTTGIRSPYMYIIIEND